MIGICVARFPRNEKVEEEQSQQRDLALEKERMATAFSNLKKLVEEDADTEAEYVKVLTLFSLLRTQ